MRPLFVLTLLLFAGAAAAQPGPAPGYGTALEYATDYGEQQATHASSDPAGYAANKTAPGAVDDEVRHTAYVACWAADDADFHHDVCDDYYTPRGQENAQQECDCNASEPVESFANETAANATLLAGNATHLLNETIEDPENVTAHAESFLDAVVAFGEATAASAQRFVEDLIDSVIACTGLASLSVRTSTASLEDLGTLASGAATLMAATVDDAASEASSALQSGAKAVGSGLASAASATGEALQTAGSAIADAAASIKDAVVGIFASDPAPETIEPVDDVVDGVDADGLLDPVTGLLS